MDEKIYKVLNNKKISIKDLNKKQILKIIIENDPISRIDISKYLKISRPTTTFYINELLEAGLIEEVGKGKSTPQGGKKAVLIRFNEKAGYIISAMIGVNNIRIALTDLRSNILESVKIPTEQWLGPGNVIKKVIENVESIIKKSKIDKKNFLGIGIGATGLVDSETGIVVFSPNLTGWYNIELKKIIEKSLDLPVYIENECRVQAIAEKRFGLAKNFKDFVCLETGAGIGTGVYVADKLLTGINGMAGELGHLIVSMDDDRICHCGNTGCLESLCSMRSLLYDIKKDLKEQNPDNYDKYENITSKDLFELYKEGNEIVVKNVNKNAEYLGIGISNAIKIFSPEIIIIHGEVIKFGEKYLNIVRETVSKNTFPMVKEEYDIQFSKLGENVGLIGASYIVFEKTFNLENFNIPDNYILKKE